MKPFFAPVAFAALALALRAVPGLASPVSNLPPSLRPQAIYGEDHRRDLFETADPVWVERARSVGAFFERDDLRDRGSSGYDLNLAPDGSEDELCTDQKFYDQPRGAFCTGFLIGPRTVLTAGHCIARQKSCEKSALVFSFAYGVPGRSVEHALREDVFFCHRLLAGGKSSSLDFALIELDRDVTSRAPLPLERSPEYQVRTRVTLIGHPEGLPAKIAEGGQIRDGSDRNTFETDLTSFTGNSGSPVFAADSGRVLGILVAGETDYVRRGKCNAVKKCPLQGCVGEDALKIDRAQLH